MRPEPSLSAEPLPIAEQAYYPDGLVTHVEVSEGRSVPSLHVLTDPLDDARRSRALFVGDLLVFRDVPVLARLRSHAEAILRDVSGASDSTDPDLIAETRRAFHEHDDTRELFAAMLSEVGVDLGRAYWDRPVLRVVPPDDRPAGAATGTLELHRDTWGSNVREQTNWWAPLRRVTPERTLAFHLPHWDRPVRNDSADWDLDAVREARRAGRQVQLAPRPTEAPDPAGELRLVVEPGDLVCFSGAHLHGSVPNTTDRTRVSIEVRTVHLDDVRQGRRAPDVDGAAPHPPAWGWFRAIHGGQPLSEVVDRAAPGRPV